MLVNLYLSFRGINCLLMSLKAQHHNWKACLFRNDRKALILLQVFFFDCLFLVTELFLWITVLVILLYFCQRCSVSRGAHKDLTMFRLSCVQVIIIFDRLHLIFRSSSESCCVFPPPKCTLVLNNVSSHWIPVISYFVLQLLITWFECK